MRRVPAIAALLALVPLAAAHAIPEPPTGRTGLPVPRFASLKSGDANMRSGPGQQYPVTWHYQRKGLPVEVLREWGPWRLVKDPDGETGWMDGAMIGPERTGYVMRAVRTLLDRPDVASKPRWRVEPGVVGKLDLCAGAWCHITIEGDGGFIPRAQLWGVYPGERIG